MGLFSNRERFGYSKELITIEDLHSGKTHTMEHGHYYLEVLPRLNSIRRASEHREASIEKIAQRTPDRFPRIATVFRALRLRPDKQTISSPVAHTSQQVL